MTNNEEVTDAFGQLLLDHQNTNKYVHYVIERDDGLIDVDSSSGYFSEYPTWPQEERNIIDQAISPVLDMGCGAGRHSLYLQAKGMEVVALDLSPGALDVARQRGVRHTIQGDINALPTFTQKFGTFLFMGNNFALCGDQETAIKILKKLTEIAKPRANIIAHFRHPAPNDPALDPVHKEYHEKNRKKGIPVGQVRIRVRYRKEKTSWFSFYLPTKEEFVEIINQSKVWQIDTLNQAGHFVFTVVRRK